MKLNSLRRLVSAITLLACAGSSAPAIAYEIQSQVVQYQVSAGRIITVSGTGTIQTSPDKGLITLAVKNWDKDVTVAYQQNEESCKKILALASSYHIEPQDIQTSEISVSPTYPAESGSSSYSYHPTSSRPVGFYVEKTILLVVKDLKSVPGVLLKALGAGATNISSVQFDSSSLRKCRD